jgi:hypothetical protein
MRPSPMVRPSEQASEATWGGGGPAPPGQLEKRLQRVSSAALSTCCYDSAMSQLPR